MGNAVFVKWFALYRKTFTGVETYCVTLRFESNCLNICKEVRDDGDAGLEDFGSQAFAAHSREYASDLYGIGEIRCGKDAQISEDLAFVFKPHMKCLPVDSVQILIGTFLFNDEDSTSSLKDSVELIGGEVGKSFFVQVHVLFPCQLLYFLPEPTRTPSIWKSSYSPG